MTTKAREPLTRDDIERAVLDERFDVERALDTVAWAIELQYMPERTHVEKAAATTIALRDLEKAVISFKEGADRG
jgi:hypothetical protein